MSERKALLIINPISGTRSKDGLSEMVKKSLHGAGISVESRFTRESGDAGRFTREGLEKGVDMVISAGGDGTVNDIANTLAHTDVPLGILPFGSGNGLARSLSIPQDLTEALKIISDGHILRCDRGKADNLPFYCTFGLGFDALVSEKFAATKRRGRITYSRNVLREFLHYRSEPYAISINGEVFTEKALLIAVCNTPQYGNNAYIAPKAKLTDGYLDITVVHSGSPLVTMMMGVELMTGYIDRNTRIDTFRVKGAMIARLHEGAVHVDGEPKMMGKHIKISCDPGALSVFAPKNGEEFKPIVSPLRAMINDMRYDMMSMLKR